MSNTFQRMTGAQLFEDKSGFRQPENFDSVESGTGWSIWVGANDWEEANTAMAAIVQTNPRYGQSSRVWVNIKHTKPPTQEEASEKERAEAKEHGDRAWRTWLRVARDLHKGTGAHSWLEAFKEAAGTKKMEPFVDEWGFDETDWTAKEIAEALLEDEDDTELVYSTDKAAMVARAFKQGKDVGWIVRTLCWGRSYRQVQILARQWAGVLEITPNEFVRIARF